MEAGVVAVDVEAEVVAVAVEGLPGVPFGSVVEVPGQVSGSGSLGFGHVTSLQSSGQNSRILLKRYHSLLRDSPVGVTCSGRWSPVILEELHLHFWRIALLPHKDGTLVAAGEPQMMKGFNPNTLADVLCQV